ncbi:MAG: hypothetical protein F9K49_00125 [Caedimonadaceae bacterium]|nr:MAG: hypothetical protein F9K49_00125 [Caedimonadaceae bacterium]
MKRKRLYYKPILAGITEQDRDALLKGGYSKDEVDFMIEWEEERQAWELYEASEEGKAERRLADQMNSEQKKRELAAWMQDPINNPEPIPF